VAPGGGYVLPVRRQHDYQAQPRASLNQPGAPDAFAAVARRNSEDDRMFDVRSVTADCADPCRQALFWSEVTGWQEDPDDPNNAGDPEGRIVSAQGFSLLFIPVPDSTTTGFPHLVVT
jgi:Glyoxalase-like domain